MRLQRYAGVMHSSGDEDETGPRDGGIGFGARGGDEEVRKCGFDGIVGPKNIDVDDGFEGIGAELGYAGEEVAGCPGSVGMKNTISSSEKPGWQNCHSHDDIDASQLFCAPLCCLA